MNKNSIKQPRYSNITGVNLSIPLSGPSMKTNLWFQASAAMLMTSAFFWVITRGRMVIPYRLLGTMYRSHLQGSRNPRRNETSVKVYHSKLRNSPEERRSKKKIFCGQRYWIKPHRRNVMRRMWSIKFIHSKWNLNRKYVMRWKFYGPTEIPAWL
jgi:hypothetical protein